VRVAATERLPSTHRPVLIQVVTEFPLLATGKVHSSVLRHGEVSVTYEERL
jgi:hypothetical protein